MQIYTCRDQTDTNKLVKGDGIWQLVTPTGETSNLTLLPTPKSDHALVFVHGFNNSLDNLRVSYHQLEANVKASGGQGLDCYGFYWPAQTLFLGYGTAFNLTGKVAPHLTAMVRQLKAVGYKKVSVFCHSMGSIVTMRAVALSNAGEFYRIVIEQGDANLDSFRVSGSYGTPCSTKLHGLFNYYSPGDEVLGFWARIGFRPKPRVGFYPFLSDSPTMYKCYNAQEIHKGEVDHSTFLTSLPLIGHAVQRLVGAL